MDQQQQEKATGALCRSGSALKIEGKADRTAKDWQFILLNIPSRLNKTSLHQRLEKLSEDTKIKIKCGGWAKTIDGNLLVQRGKYKKYVSGLSLDISLR